MATGKRQRGFSTLSSVPALMALVLLFVSVMGPTAQAAEINLATVTGNTVAANGDVLTGTLGAKVSISIANNATVTLKDVTIEGENKEAYSWAGITCRGNATLVIEGKNRVTAFNRSYPAIYVPSNYTLTIQGSGSLEAGDAKGYNGAGIGGGWKTDLNCGNIVILSGTITANGSGAAAGIGSGLGSTCGDITILGGTVTANGGPTGEMGGGAGIGTGRYAKCGFITILGGKVTANGGGGAAAIGCGSRASSCYDVNISGGIVTATKSTENYAYSPYSVGASSDNKSTCGSITIAGNKVVSGSGNHGISVSPYTTSTTSIYELSTLGKLYGHYDHLALDGETLTDTTDTTSTKVKVSIADGATVTLKDMAINGGDDKSFQCPGLTCEGDATLILEGNNTVKGFNNREPGIYVPEGKTLTIKGKGTLTAQGTNHGSGIGSGKHSSDEGIPCGNIVIESGTVNAIGGNYAAAIGSGPGAAGGTITITGGTVNATGTWTGAAIGTGNGGSCGDITITGGTVKALVPEGASTGAGIGGGGYGKCANILITGGNVTAAGGKDSAGIGCGSQGLCGNITLTGGTVIATGGPNGAGIGTGLSNWKPCTCGDITIGTAAKVTATKGSGALNDIGVGVKGTCGNFILHIAKEDSLHTGATKLEEYLSGIPDQGDVTELKIDYSKTLENLTGIEKLTKLQKLSIANCPELLPVILTSKTLKELSVDQCDTLGEVSVKDCTALTKLTVTNCSDLKQLNLNGHKTLKQVTLSGCEMLKEVDVRNCTALTALTVTNNNFLKTLKLDNTCKKLTNLNCSGNSLGALDVGWLSKNSQNAKLTCKRQSIYGWNAALTIDLSKYAGKVENVQPNIKAYDFDGKAIALKKYDAKTGKAQFAQVPDHVVYQYKTGFKNVLMDVTVDSAKGGSASGETTPWDVTEDEEDQVIDAFGEVGGDTSEVLVMPLTYQNIGSNRYPEDLTSEQMNYVSSGTKAPAAILPEISIEEAGIYCFKVTLDSRIQTGATLEWYPFPSSDSLVRASIRLAGNEGKAVFMKNGQRIKTVPIDHEVEVAAYFDEGDYEPVIAAVTTSAGGGSGGSGGGCDAGLGLVALLCALPALLRKRRG